jgi:hypothetical protein
MRKASVQLQKMFAILLAVTLLLGACQTAPPGPVVEPQGTSQPAAPTQEPAQGRPLPSKSAPTEAQPSPSTVPTEASQDTGLFFAKFNEPPVQAQASLNQEPIASDLRNVDNPFVLSSEQIQRLAQDGFVVTPGTEKEFFTVYEKARYDNVPAFVTSDSLLHSYHLLFDKVLRSAEVQYFIPLLRDLNASMLTSVEAEYEQLKGGPWEEAALSTVAYVAVASKLLDASVEVPAYAGDLVNGEMALINAAQGIQPSPIFPGYDYGEDYTQYIPRGHYTLSEDLKSYFKSMMWYGRMSFRLKPNNADAGRAETRMALLLVQALRNSQVNGRPALDAWSDLYNPTVFFVGHSDDLMATQYIPIMDQIYGPDASLQTIADDSKLDAFIEAANQLPAPKILGMVINAQDDEEAQTKGLRFMGQRFVPDAYIFRQLIYRNVGTGDNRRGLPKGLDLLAAMGSERAYTLLDQMGDTQYANYPEQMQKVQSWLQGLSVNDWTETLYNTWLYSFYPLLDPPGKGYPSFMQSQAWLDKQINTSLGSWAELKHDTILYAKQVYAEMGGGPPPPQPVPPKGYVEPVPEFYARLSALTDMTLQGLDQRGLLDEVDRSNLQRLDELVRSFQSMAEKELRGEALTQEEYDTIRFYGGDLEHFVMAAADTDASDPFAQQYMEQEPQAAVVADVATDPDPDNDGAPNPVVLEEAVGRINEIHAVVPIVQADGSLRLQVVKGGVFSYYEFQWPADDRLTDEKWRGMLDGDQAPALPTWTSSFFIPQAENSALVTAIHNYQNQITALFWDFGWMLGPGEDFPSGYENLIQFKPQVQALAQAGEYLGHQLISSNVTASDLQAADKAVVNVREVWDDNRYQGQYPDSGVPAIARRGPYTLNATYTLENKTEDGTTTWVVTNLSYAEEPPAWETP